MRAPIDFVTKALGTDPQGIPDIFKSVDIELPEL